MKKSFKSAVALLASLTMAVTALPAIGASANSNDVYTTSYKWYNASTGKYYDSKEEAIEASSSADVYDGYAINNNYSVNFSLTYPYYSAYTKKYYPSVFSALAVSKGNSSQIVYGGPDGSAVYDGTHTYYSSYTKRYYSTYAEALSHSANVEGYVIKTNGTVASTTGTVYYYYSSYTKKYYVSYGDALTASKGNPAYVEAVYGSTATGTGDYYNSKTGKWYTTLSAALAAYNNAEAYVSYTGTNFTVWLASNGRYYATKDEAVKASGGDNVTSYSISRTAPVKAAAVTSVDAPAYYNGYYYYNGKYYYGYPYYYGYYYGYPNYTYTTASAATEGVPYLKGYSTRNSWTNLATYVKNSRSGSVVQITMNGATSVPDTFMSALKGRNVTVVFYMDNGVRWTVNGTNITSAQTVDLSVSYDANEISDTLVKKATSGAVAAAEVSVGTGSSSLGFKGNCTIKFSSERSNLFAKAYVYDKENKRLKLVSRAVTDDEGYVSFIASESGTYLVVLS